MYAQPLLGAARAPTTCPAPCGCCGEDGATPPAGQAADGTWGEASTPDGPVTRYPINIGVIMTYRLSQERAAASATLTTYSALAITRLVAGRRGTDPRPRADAPGVVARRGSAYRARRGDRHVRFGRRGGTTATRPCCAAFPVNAPTREARTAPLRSGWRFRSVVSSLPKERGLSPANGVIQDGSDAVITLTTS